MSKIIKHTFNIPNLAVKDGELVEGEPRKKTYTFTLLYRGVGLFEEITGKSLFKTIMENVVASGNDESQAAMNMMDKDLIQTLASVSYVKIDEDRFHNNRATVEEFKKTPVFPLLSQDVNFASKLYTMAVECLSETEKSDKRTRGASNRSKK